MQPGTPNPISDPLGSLANTINFQNTQDGKNQFYSQIGSLAGQYGPNQVNQLAQQFSNNPFGVSFQELQGMFGQGANPNYGLTPTNNSTSTTGTSGTSAAATQGVIDQLNRELQSIGVQRDTGLNNIEQGYNLNLDRTNQAQGTALSNLAQQSQQNATNRENNYSSIDSSARNAFDGLMRVLGLGGASVSSAAQNNVPYAVAREATSQRQGATNTYGQNQQGIDQATTQTKQGYQNALTDLLNQKNMNTQNFLSGIDQQAGNIESNLAAAGAPGAAGAANDIQNQLDSLFKQYQTPSYQVQPVNVTTPNLASYTVDPLKVNAQNQNPQTDASVLPFLAQMKQPNILQSAGAGTLGG